MHLAWEDELGGADALGLRCSSRKVCSRDGCSIEDQRVVGNSRHGMHFDDARHRLQPNCRNLGVHFQHERRTRTCTEELSTQAKVTDGHELEAQTSARFVSSGCPACNTGRFCVTLALLGQRSVSYRADTR